MATAFLSVMAAMVVVGCRPSAVVPPTNRPAGPLPSPPDPSFSSTPAMPGEAMPVGGSQSWRPEERERQWQYIVIHHTATSQGSVAAIDRVHRTRKDAAGRPWLGIGYHFVIGNSRGMRDGEVEPTFRWRRQMHGAHAGVGNYNEFGIGIAMVGDFNQGPPTTAQLVSVKRLVGFLKRRYGISADRVVGHGDIKNTACPGRFFPLADISRSLPETQFGQHRVPAVGPLARLPREETPYQLATSKGMSYR